MFAKLFRFVTLLLVIGILGASGVVRAAPPSLAGTAISLAAASSPGVQFVQVATAANITGSATIVDHPLINSDPNAVIIATPNWNPGGPGGGFGVYNDHPIAVGYLFTKWLIVNQDIAPMPAHAAFNVLVPKAGPNAFVHTATATNTSGNSTLIDNPLTNGKPNAKILVTPIGTTNSHPIGVWYDGTKWGIFNQDLATMPIGVSFNVFVIPETYAGGFVHKATATNISGNITVIDHPLTNNNPNALVFVTQNWNPGGGGGTYNNHNISVYYAGGKWRIFNQDLATMPTNTAFNVLVLVPQSATFVHKATSANSTGHVTDIDHPLSNNDPNAIVFITPNWNPGGVGGTYNNHNIGVYYEGSPINKWSIFNQDIATMPNDAAFNVLIPHPDASVFVHKATTANTSGHITTIDYPLTNNKPNAILLVTPNWNPGNVGGTYNNHPIGVYYTGGKWTIFNQDFAAMPPNAAFNVIVPRPGPGEAVFVHQASAVNTASHVTYIDHPLTNGNPTALVLVTPNWNPGGGGGTYNNHPIGVYYDTIHNKWAIFNQDIASIQIGAAFNVFVKTRRVYLPLTIR